MQKTNHYLPYALLLVSAGLLGWGVLGLIEYAFPEVGFGLQNDAFPNGLQFLHFLSILITGFIFVFGFWRRWPPTPYATITMYAVLATLCFIETVDFGAFGGGTKGIMIMAMEFVLYFVLATYLLRSSSIKKHFDPL